MCDGFYIIYGLKGSQNHESKSTENIWSDFRDEIHFHSPSFTVQESCDNLCDVELIRQ